MAEHPTPDVLAFYNRLLRTVADRLVLDFDELVFDWNGPPRGWVDPVREIPPLSELRVQLADLGDRLDDFERRHPFARPPRPNRVYWSPAPPVDPLDGDLWGTVVEGDHAWSLRVTGRWVQVFAW